ncbi:hypothetical protein [Hyphomicrobium sp.]|uniref:hypothetical protein n=1 Tax=Hyphomicrobium sp. TaxID=82 RepID=UPI002D776914|nr:hypothetical protein [Hyphomicrobium sp.]HET6389205.1 hypothetical protein [Hyphomicrobium sp.]
MQNRRSRHVWEFVETLLGPIIYLGFFGLSYFVATLGCVLSRGNEPMIADPQTTVRIAVLVLTFLALAMIARLTKNGVRLLSQGRDDREDTFLGMLTLALAALSALAIIWTALPVATVQQSC